ncbi:hypothetical protein ABPG75_004058 [Micractinium tetrahymenae]
MSSPARVAQSEAPAADSQGTVERRIEGLETAVGALQTSLELHQRQVEQHRRQMELHQRLQLKNSVAAFNMAARLFNRHARDSDDPLEPLQNERGELPPGGHLPATLAERETLNAANLDQLAVFYGQSFDAPNRGRPSCPGECVSLQTHRQAACNSGGAPHDVQPLHHPWSAGGTAGAIDSGSGAQGAQEPEPFRHR